MSMVPSENNTTQVSSGSRAIKFLAIIFGAAFVVMAGIVGLIFFERVGGVTTIRQTSNEAMQVSDSSPPISKRSVTEDKMTKTGGTSYIRWGWTTCPGNGSDVIYSGQAGGSHYTHTGAAVSMLCLPSDPDWLLYTDEMEDDAFIFGTEYESSNGRTDKFFGTGHENQDVGCTVCYVQTRSSTIMVPGKTKCPPGWTIEYIGYIMSGKYDHKAASDYYCIDRAPENLKHTAGNMEGKLLYFVEARCGSLKCPPYINYRELTCVVCSK